MAIKNIPVKNLYNQAWGFEAHVCSESGMTGLYLQGMTIRTFTSSFKMSLSNIKEHQLKKNKQNKEISVYISFSENVQVIKHQVKSTVYACNVNYLQDSSQAFSWKENKLQTKWKSSGGMLRQYLLLMLRREKCTYKTTPRLAAYIWSSK